MKKLKLSLTVLLSALIMCSFTLQAQTYQFELSGTVDAGQLICGKVVNGYWIYHVTYKLNKDGELTRLHWNLTKAELFDVETGERMKIHDTGTDNLGAIWDVFNNLNAWNEGFGVVYDQADGWMTPFLPSEYPTEGTFVNMNFRLHSKGFKGRWSSLVQVHVNAKGELTASVVKDEYLCE